MNPVTILSDIELIAGWIKSTKAALTANSAEVVNILEGAKTVFDEIFPKKDAFINTLFNKIISKWEKEFPVPVATPATPAIPTLS